MVEGLIDHDEITRFYEPSKNILILEQMRALYQEQPAPVGDDFGNTDFYQTWTLQEVHDAWNHLNKSKAIGHDALCLRCSSGMRRLMVSS